MMFNPNKTRLFEGSFYFEKVLFSTCHKYTRAKNIENDNKL